MINRRFKYASLILFLLASYATPISASPSSLSNPSDSIQRAVIQPSVIINGMNVSFKGSLPALVDGTTFVSTQFFEHPAIQANIYEFQGNEFSQVAIFHHFNGGLTIFPDVSHYLFDDYFVDENLSNELINWTSTPPYLTDGDIMVPLRVLAEQIGISVDWDIATSTAILTTDEDFRAELESPEEWAEFLGNKPIEFDDPSGEAITEEELTTFVTSSELSVLDSRIIDKYTAILLYSEEKDGVESLMLMDVERKRNGNLNLGSVGIGMGDTGKDVKVKRIGPLVSVGMFEQGLDKEFTHFEVTYSTHEDTVSITYDITGKQGMFFDIPQDVTSGVVTFYGKNDYVLETYFF